MMPMEDIQESLVGFPAKENPTKPLEEANEKMLGESKKGTVSAMRTMKVWRGGLLDSGEKSLR